MPPMGHPPLKNEAPPNWKTTPPPPLKSEAPFQEMTPRKKTEKSKTVINICVSIIKQHWKKMAEIPQEHDFLKYTKFSKKSETVC